MWVSYIYKKFFAENNVNWQKMRRCLFYTFSQFKFQSSYRSYAPNNNSLISLFSKTVSILHGNSIEKFIYGYLTLKWFNMHLYILCLNLLITYINWFYKQILIILWYKYSDIFVVMDNAAQENILSAYITKVVINNLLAQRSLNC